jgi:DNA-binding SARP family transcriptional activator
LDLLHGHAAPEIRARDENKRMPTLDLQIHLLGSFRLRFHGEALPGFDHARPQELLAYLLLHRQHPIARQQLAFLFWPDSTEEQARTNLRNLWLRLRRALPEADRLLTADELSVQWRGDDTCWLDVADFEYYLQQARTAASSDCQVQDLERAAALYSGELLPGCYSDWLLIERERLAQAYAAARERLAALYEARRDYPTAISHAQALLRHDPLHEPAYAQLMRLHALNDDRAAVLHTYHTCATVLRRELDVEPGPETRALYTRLLAASPASAAQRQAEAAIPLVGRETEWGQLTHAWRAAVDRPRLALIIGEAGIGKTRLADALAEWVGRQGISTLAAHCYAAGGDLAYAPVAAWLRGQPRPPLADPWLRELARLLPEIGSERPDLPAPAPLTETWQRLRLFEALIHALLVGRSALLLILDDLQWCDHDTLGWLHYLLAARLNLPMQPQLLVVATLRSEESEADASLTPWRANLARSHQLTEIELGPLSQEATLALAERVAGRPFDRALGSRLYQGTEGHPLFVVEMARAGAAHSLADPTQDAAMPTTPVALPDRVRRVLDARLAQLSPPARGVIELAAVVGRAFTFGVLTAASDLGEETLVAALDEGWRRLRLHPREAARGSLCRPEPYPAPLAARSGGAGAGTGSCQRPGSNCRRAGWTLGGGRSACPGQCILQPGCGAGASPVRARGRAGRAGKGPGIDRNPARRRPRSKGRSASGRAWRPVRDVDAAWPRPRRLRRGAGRDAHV